MSSITARFATTALFAALAASSAHADLTLPTNILVANSVQTFTADNLASFDAVNLVVEARGTTFVVRAGTPGLSNGTVTPVAFGFPITKVVIGSGLNIVSGTASGSALYFNRMDPDTGKATALTLANFTINYKQSKVLADATVQGGKTEVQMPLYDFTATSPLALKYKFPLTVTGHEVLDHLLLSDSAKALFTSALKLPEFATPALDLEFGNLTQDISTTLRKKAISGTPYVAQ